MRNGVIGLVIGAVVGVVVGATALAPRLEEAGSRAVPGNPGNPGNEPAPGVPPPPPPEKPTPTPPLERAPHVVHWRMVSTYGSSMPQLGTLAKRVTERTRKVSEGRLDITFHEPGTLVSRDGLFRAVSTGTVDAVFASPGFWREQEPALALFGAVPFGPQPDAYMAWLYFGGGRKLYDELYHRHKLHGIPCGMMPPEGAGWFRRQVDSVEDLIGLRIAISGLAADVLDDLGAEPHDLAPGDIFLALETGELDAAEFSMPAVDLQLGLHEMAPYYYFPGWHQPATVLDLVVNLGRWNALSSEARAQLESVCGDNMRFGLAHGEATQFEALKTLQEKGVEIRRWPPEVLDALRRTWSEVAAEKAKGDVDFRRVWQALQAFRRDYRIWKELGQL